MDIKATDIKTLREKTGAGMMDCKKALVEAEGDFAAAEKLLREWGMAGVEKRSGRATNEGRVFVLETGKAISLVEIVCETDFVAKNADFIAAGDKIGAKAFEMKADGPNETLEAMVKDIAVVIKENIALKRVRYFTAAPGEYLHSYSHGEGKIVVVVKASSSSGDAFASETVKTFVHDTALHIAAFSPMFLDQSKPDAAWVEEQKEIFAKQVELDEKLKSKPAKVVEGILAGKLKKLMSEVCLLDQPFVRDEKMSVATALAAAKKESGFDFSIVDYYYIKVGEAA
ncbi:MAG: translation elongation factor Ts [Spirochaetia bacterium]|nr:translation elongation factor Ts [Spirochaetia bacterium]MCE1209078.1 translation elongation factor Ts [Spirochaetia bacterium]